MATQEQLLGAILSAMTGTTGHGGTAEQSLEGILSEVTADGNMPAANLLALKSELAQFAKVIATGTTTGLTAGSFGAVGGTILVIPGAVLLFNYAATTDFTYGQSNALVFNFSNMAALVTIELSSSGIIVPPILTNCTGLLYLNCQYSALTTPPVLTTTPALEALFLSSTNITTPPVLAACSRVTTLEIYATNITTPPVLTGLSLLSHLLLLNCSNLSTASVDAVYNSLVGQSAASAGLVNTSGTAGDASATSLSARDALIARGWTVAI